MDFPLELPITILKRSFTTLPEDINTLVISTINYLIPFKAAVFSGEVIMQATI